MLASAVAESTRRSMSGADNAVALLLRGAAHWPYDTHDAAGAAPVVPDTSRRFHCCVPAARRPDRLAGHGRSRIPAGRVPSGGAGRAGRASTRRMTSPRIIVSGGLTCEALRTNPGGPLPRPPAAGRPPAPRRTVNGPTRRANRARGREPGSPVRAGHHERTRPPDGQAHRTGHTSDRRTGPRRRPVADRSRSGRERRRARRLPGPSTRAAVAADAGVDADGGAAVQADVAEGVGAAVLVGQGPAVQVHRPAGGVGEVDPFLVEGAVGAVVPARRVVLHVTDDHPGTVGTPRVISARVRPCEHCLTKWCAAQSQCALS